jgi:1,4-dihydroxy-2-naphthoate polyprenyltransferase
MNLKSFLKLVEIKTKIASVIPFIIGTLYAAYHFHRINVENLVIFFISMITFDMVTTAINNYFDFKKANKKSGYNYEKHNAMVRYNLNPKTVIFIIIFMLALASFTGFILFLNTDVIVLIVGVLCFSTGVVYSYGPVPVSRTPSGEFFSGLMMGFFILFLSVYIHVYDLGFISFSWDNGIFGISMNYVELLYIIILSIPCFCGIANIMLANNICDVECDLVDKRYTLPIYIGKDKSLILFASLYLFAFIAIAILAILNILTIFILIALVTVIPVSRNVIAFFKVQSKKDTFPFAVMNFMLIGGIMIVLLAIIISCNMIFNGMKIDFILK